MLGRLPQRAADQQADYFRAEGGGRAGAGGPQRRQGTLLGPLRRGLRPGLGPHHRREARLRRRQRAAPLLGRVLEDGAVDNKENIAEKSAMFSLF